MKILITGNRGFVGTETQKYLESMRIKNPRFNPLISEHSMLSQPEFIKEHEIIGYDLMDGYDICDYRQLDSVVRDTKPDRILHLAAIARFADADKNPRLAIETNITGTRNVANVAEKYHVPVVYASTGSVYMPIKEDGAIKETFECKGNSVYGVTKYGGETFIREVNPHIILRYAHLYGKEKRMHGLIGGFVERIQRGLAPTLYGGKQSNDFTYIKDVAYANFLALTAPWDKWNQVYNIGTGEELTAGDAGKIICKTLGWPEDQITIEQQRTVDPDRFFYDMTKAKVMLGFEPQFTFAQGLADMFKDDQSTS